jgi:ParB family chromosome partitioning protein
LATLTASVAELGVLQPILVRDLGNDRFELIAGERRWRAAKRAGLPSLPVVVRSVDDVLSLEQALVENLHREDLNPLEEAAAYQQLMEDFSLTQEQVAQKVGKSRSSVANTLRLFQLPPAIQRLVAENQLAAGHAKALLGTPDRAFQERLAKDIVASGLSVREAEEAVRLHNEALDGKEPSPSAAEPAAVSPTRRLRAPGLLELEELLAEHLDTRVRVSMAGTNGRGKVVIEFGGLEDLERIYRSMTEGRATDA